MNMIKMNKLLAKWFLLSLATAKLCGAFMVLPSSNTRIISSEINNNDNSVTGIGLFRAYDHSRYERSNGGLHQTTPNHTQSFARGLSRKLKIVRSILSFRISSLWNNNKKRYLSIIAAAIIAAGTFPSHVTAETATNANSSTSNTAEITRTVAETYFDQEQVSLDTHVLADCIDAESLASSDYEYATTADNFPTTQPVVEDASQVIATGVTHAPEGDLMVLNDIMIKKGFRNIAVVGSGAVTLSLLKKKVNAVAFNSDEDSDIDDDRVQEGYKETIISDREEKIDSITVYETKSSCLLPLSDRKLVKARVQPKSESEEAALAVRYNAIPTVEERAYQILVDLEMIEVTN